MKLTIISVIISLLSIAECDPCEPSYFSTSSGCKKCFCSGATDQCHAGLFYTGVITGGLDGIRASLEVYSGPLILGTLTASTEPEYHFSGKHQNVRLLWILPPTYYGNRARSYGGRLNLTQTITAPPGAAVNDTIRVFLDGGVTEISRHLMPVNASENNFMYSIPLYESSWKVTTEKNRLATRADMMKVLATLQLIIVVAPHVAGMEAVSMKDVSMDVAVDSSSREDSYQTDSIEICQCPRGYNGESCESCSDGYYRDFDNKTGSVFGTCQACQCDGDNVGCKMDEYGEIMCK